MKLNSGNMHFKKPIESCSIKSNNAVINADSVIKNIEMKLNNGIINLMADSQVEMWNIKANKANITIKTAEKIHLKGRNEYAIGNGRINIKTRGLINITE